MPGVQYIHPPLPNQPFNAQIGSVRLSYFLFCVLNHIGFFQWVYMKKKSTDRPSEYLGRSQPLAGLAGHQCVGREGNVHVTVMGWSWHLLSHSWEAWFRSNSQPGYSFIGSTLPMLGIFWDCKLPHQAKTKSQTLIDSKKERNFCFGLAFFFFQSISLSSITTFHFDHNKMFCLAVELSITFPL